MHFKGDFFKSVLAQKNLFGHVLTLTRGDYVIILNQIKQLVKWIEK